MTTVIHTAIRPGPAYRRFGGDLRGERYPREFQPGRVREQRDPRAHLMSSPAQGRRPCCRQRSTSSRARSRSGIIEGDIATDLDAAKLRGRGAQVSLLNTSNGLAANAISTRPWSTALYRGLDLPGLDLVIIENVGNLVCPAEFDVGEHAKAMVYSVTEGGRQAAEVPGDVPIGGYCATQQD